MDHFRNHPYRSETSLLWLSYLLYLLFFTAPLGFAISFYKAHQFKEMMKNTTNVDEDIKLLESHHEWLSQTFIFTVFMTMAALGTLFYFFGYLIALVAVVWWIYRLGRGIVLFVEHKHMPVLA